MKVPRWILEAGCFQLPYSHTTDVRLAPGRAGQACVPQRHPWQQGHARLRLLQSLLLLFPSTTVYKHPHGVTANESRFSAI